MEILFLVIGFVSGGLIASLFWETRDSIWRIRWIEMEHDLARAVGREPRDINTAIKGKA